VSEKKERSREKKISVSIKFYYVFESKNRSVLIRKAMPKHMAKTEKRDGPNKSLEANKIIFNIT